MPKGYVTSVIVAQLWFQRPIVFTIPTDVFVNARKF